jgi:hypothetical protein
VREWAGSAAGATRSCGCLPTLRRSPDSSAPARQW